MRGFLASIRPYAPFVLRLVVAALAISFSMSKVFHGMGAFFKDVEAWGLPRWVAQGAAWGSLAGGFLLLLGFFTRLAAVVVGAVTVVVAWKTRLHAGFTGGLDFPLLTVTACLSLLLSGAGRPSLDDKLFGRYFG